MIFFTARAISTSNAAKYVSSSISRDLLISRLRDCAHLVCGVWLIKSEILYKTDQEAVFRAARDLALVLLNSGLTVRRFNFLFFFFFVGRLLFFVFIDDVGF